MTKKKRESDINILLQKTGAVLTEYDGKNISEIKKILSENEEIVSLGIHKCENFYSGIKEVRYLSSGDIDFIASREGQYRHHKIKDNDDNIRSLLFRGDKLVIGSNLESNFLNICYAWRETFRNKEI